MTKIYYFAPDYQWDEVGEISHLTEQQCEEKLRSNNEVTCYSLKDFEFAFNSGVISDFGYVRIF